MYLWDDSEDCDQTEQMPRLILAKHTCHFVGFACGSFAHYTSLIIMVFLGQSSA